MTDYARQFDEAHEVLEITQSEGFKTLKADIEKQVERCDSDIKDLIQELTHKAGESDANQGVQKLIKLQSRKEGLLYIINQVAHYKKKKDQAIKKS